MDENPGRKLVRGKLDQDYLQVLRQSVGLTDTEERVHEEHVSLTVLLGYPRGPMAALGRATQGIR